MIHLRSLCLKPEARGIPEFPFSLPLLQTLDEIAFSAPVTFFVGENGSGKSTILEGIAAQACLPTVGGTEVEKDDTLLAARKLARHLTLAWTVKTRRGFFLRAEDFFNFTRRQRQINRDMTGLEEDFSRTLQGYGRQLATGAASGERRAMTDRYGGELDTVSHGESFLRLFQSRFRPNGLFLLDEPEAPLSPKRQMALLSLLKEMTSQNSQFIIATHSPILMAFPGALIIDFDSSPPKAVEYDQLEHVTLTRDFLNRPESFLRHL